MHRLNIPQKYFSDITAGVNTQAYNSAGELTDIKAYSIQLFEKNDQMMIVKHLKKNNFVIIDLSKQDNLSLKELSSWQQSFLGKVICKKNPNNFDYSIIKPSKKGRYLANSNKAQPLHTDEGYAMSFPKYISLYCQSNSKTGGISILVKFEDLFSEIKKKFHSNWRLLENRQTFNVVNIDGSSNRPLLIKLANHSYGISYSSIFFEMTCDEIAFKMYDFITNYIHDVNNQIRFKLKEKHLVIINNLKMFHGRTGFYKSDDRVMYRFWFDEYFL